ncbi:Asp/Glu racemase [Sulfitobacter aestuarii]|uniref:Asp/Glu racemase n=1 Tax=Sulfitobacter aestuarii TaxID=2161676 RepID=A0ABW5U2X5_9RHOB
MLRYQYDLKPPQQPALGMIVLKSDQVIEGDFRRMLPPDQPVHVTRVESAAEVSPRSLQDMARHMSAAAALLPEAAEFAAIGYGCTSGTAQIGAARIAELVREGRSTGAVSEPLSALVAASRALGVTRLGLLSPYVASVSDTLRTALGEAGVETPVFGSFEEAEEARVVAIDPVSIKAAALDLARQGKVEALFLSCTNLQTLDVIEDIEAETGLPCLSSNQALCWHLSRLAGIKARVPGRLGRLAV